MPKKAVNPFRFKQFAIHQDRCAMKVGTDGVLLGAWADTSGARRILDIGTGTGVIAIMLGQRAPEAEVHAVEIEEASFQQARENMEAAPWAARLKVFHAAIQEFRPGLGQLYELIVSNPPFFSGGTFSSKQDRNSVRHTIKLPHGDLLSAVRNLLSPEGRFCLVLPYIEGLRFQELAKSYSLHCSRVLEVKPTVEKPVERLLMQFERQPKALQEESLVIQHEKRNEWTEDYMQLTRDFYLKM